MISPYQVVYAGVRPNVERLVIIVRGFFQILRRRQDTPTSLNSFPRTTTRLSGPLHSLHRPALCLNGQTTFDHLFTFNFVVRTHKIKQ